MLASVPTGAEHDLAALVRRHLAPLDAHVGHTGVHADALFDLPLDVGAQGAPTDGQLDGDTHDPVVVDVDRRHHAERHDVGAKFGIDDGFEDRAHLVDTRGGGGHEGILPAIAV